MLSLIKRLKSGSFSTKPHESHGIDSWNSMNHEGFIQKSAPIARYSFRKTYESQGNILRHCMDDVGFIQKFLRITSYSFMNSYESRGFHFENLMNHKVFIQKSVWITKRPLTEPEPWPFHSKINMNHVLFLHKTWLVKQFIHDSLWIKTFFTHKTRITTSFFTKHEEFTNKNFETLVFEARWIEYNLRTPTESGTLDSQILAMSASIELKDKEIIGVFLYSTINSLLNRHLVVF